MRSNKQDVKDYREISTKVPIELYNKLKSYKEKYGLKTWRDFLEYCLDTLENKSLRNEEVIKEIRNLRILILQLIDKISKMEVLLKDLSEKCE